MDKFKFHETQHLKDLMGDRATNRHNCLGTPWKQLAQLEENSLIPARSHSLFDQQHHIVSVAEGYSKNLALLSNNTTPLLSPHPPLLKQFPKNPTSWWLQNWRTADPVRVGQLPLSQKSFQEMRGHRQGRSKQEYYPPGEDFSARARLLQRLL